MKRPNIAIVISATIVLLGSLGSASTSVLAKSGSLGQNVKSNSKAYLGKTAPPGKKTEAIKRKHATDLGIVAIRQKSGFSHKNPARIGNKVRLQVFVRNYGRASRRAYVAVVKSQRRGTKWRTVAVTVPAGKTRKVSIAAPVLNAPIRKGQYRATVSLMARPNPGLLDVLRDGNKRNNALTVGIPVVRKVSRTGKTGKTSAGLISGSNDVNTRDANAVVLVGSGCTGTLIDSNIVLTAGHCVNHGYPGNIRDASGRVSAPAIRRDQYQNDWETSGQWYPLYMYPRGIKIYFGNDRDAPIYEATATEYNLPVHADMIALRLDSFVPSRIAKPKSVLYYPPTTVIRNWRDQRFRTVGWGGPSAARYRQVGTARNGVTPCFTFGRTQPHKMCVTGNQIEPGDSGGPLFWTHPWNGKEYLVGVTQGVEANGGRYTITFYRGGRDSAGTPIPDLGAWARSLIPHSIARFGMGSHRRR